jgi:hypothetical protein
MKRVLWIILAVGLFFRTGLPSESRWRLEAESGLAFSGYNDIRIPGDSGTKFSFSRDLRGRISFLAAPLSLRAAGTIGRPIAFAGTLFPGGTRFKARYTFNSYRLTYAHRVVESETWTVDLGLTAKVRDAVIRLEGAGLTAEKKNVGPVPLIHFAVGWNGHERLGLILEVDALAAPQGRAEDVFLGMRFSLTPSLTMKAGYRVLEGGADNEKVFTFALIHYLVAGLVWEF